jgi:hypothetical protein
VAKRFGVDLRYEIEFVGAWEQPDRMAPGAAVRVDDA